MKKIKTIGILGVVSIVFALLSIVMFIIFFSSLPSDPLVDASMSDAFSILFIIAITISGIISLTGSILTLATNFENNEINESKILWGLLSLLILGPIGLIIFSSLNYKKVVDNIETTTSQNSKTKHNNLETVEKAFKMFEEGSITKEEFDKIKNKNL